jgi:hypothetical protein
MAGFFEQNFNFSLFYQNLNKTIFFKNSRRTWLGKVWTNKKWPETLISEHLVAVNPCGLRVNYVSTVKSRNNQIWIFLFDGFNLAHSSSHSTFEVFGTRILVSKCSQSSDFGQLWGRFKRISFFFWAETNERMRDVYFDYRLPWPAKTVAKMLTPGKWRPFEIYLTTLWTAPYFDHTYLGFSSIKSNGF